MTRNVTDLLVDCDPRDRVGEEVNRRNSGNSGKSLFTTIATTSAILTTNEISWDKRCKLSILIYTKIVIKEHVLIFIYK